MTTETNCPVCGYKIDAATAVSNEGAAPRDGDITVCMKCTSFLMFINGLDLRLLTLEEVGDLDDDLRIEMVRVRNLIKERRAHKKTKHRPLPLDQMLRDIFG